MAQKTAAQNALQLALRSCMAALNALKTPEPLSIPPPHVGTLHKDFISLLSLVYAQATKLAILLKPASPTYSAAVSPAQDMSKHVVAIATCAALFDPRTHGATLVSEARSTAQEVLESVTGLLQALISSLTSPNAEDNGDYLVRTGAVHELVEMARGPDGLSQDNLSAVRKKWKEDQSVLKDAFKEIEELLQDTSDEEEEEDDFDDGWDELGLKESKMTPEEMSRVKTVQPILRMVMLLHKRTMLDLLTDPKSRPFADFDPFVSLSAGLLSDFDDLVAALHPGQQTHTIIEAVQALVARTMQIKTSANPLLPSSTPDLAANMSTLGVVGTSMPPPKPGKDISKWFSTCFAQIESLSKNAEAGISNPVI